MTEKDKQFPTQSDVVLYISTGSESEIEKFKKGYFDCLKRRAEYENFEKDKNYLFQCVRDQELIESILNYAKLSEDEKYELELVRELMRLQGLDSHYGFKEKFELVISGDKNNPERQKLIADYTKAKKEGREWFDLDAD